MALGRRKRNEGADRLTLGLAAVAVATAGTVLAGEVIRLARRRAAEESAEHGVPPETAELSLGAATQAAQDSLTVAIEGYTAASKQETILFNLLGGFVGSFALMRFSTWGIRSGWWPAGNVSLGGRHVHHFIPGILIAFLAGGAGLSTKSDRLEQLLAVPFGAGIGMTFDESALLLELDDVYWSREGLLSVQLSLGLVAVLGATILGLRMLRSGERESEQAGLIPDETGEYKAPGLA
ncbi:MAG: hypothetical protein ABWZ43_07890 [Solirubrobacterales bacterium]